MPLNRSVGLLLKKRLQHIKSSSIFLFVLCLFYVIYSEIDGQRKTVSQEVVKSDAIFYHEYIAVYAFGTEPYHPDGKIVNKYTMGVSVAYIPAVGVGYLLSEMKGIPHQHGQNYLYQKLYYYLSFIYGLIGLIYLRRIARRWLKEFTVTILLACIFFGTNMYYYIRVDPMMSHSVSFAFITAFVFYSIRMFEKPQAIYSIYMGILLGLIALVRIPNTLIAVFPIIYFLTSKNIPEGKWGYAKLTCRFWLIIPLLTCILFIPQMIYWHSYTGQWLYYSYYPERFFWTKPAILPLIFSFRNGWFIYTPLMALIIPGAIICYKRNVALFWSLLCFSILHIYLISCWWCWWYGASFGMRPLIDSYGLFAIWIGIFIDYIFAKVKVLVPGLILLLGFIVYLNLFQTRQARLGWIHFDSMTSKAYCKVFLTEKYTFTEEEWKNILDPPDYKKALAGERF